MAVPIFEIFKVFRIGYSINAWLWLGAIIIMWFGKDQLTKSIETVILRLPAEFCLWFILGWFAFSTVLDLLLVIWVFPRLDSLKTVYEDE